MTSFLDGRKDGPSISRNKVLARYGIGSIIGSMPVPNEIGFAQLRTLGSRLRRAQE